MYGQSMQSGQPQNSPYNTSVNTLNAQPMGAPIIVPVMVIEHNARLKCPICNEATDTIVKKTYGRTTWSWFVCMIFTTGLCCIPFFVDRCKDVQQVCSRCGNVKGVI
jgi:hypothetical protein